jgi:hypothetical protein
MKTFRKSIVAVLLLSLGIFFTPAQADTTPTITKSGVTLSFPNPIYTVTGATQVVATYVNNSGFELGTLRYEVTDKFGTIVAGTTSSAYYVKNGSSGTITDTWFSFDFAKATAPYTITLKISYMFGSGKPDEIASVPFEFTSRVASTPTPAPTVTVIATPVPAPTVTITAKPVQAITDWAAMESLKAELAITKNDLKTLNAKLKKICSNKPKPKGC